MLRKEKMFPAPRSPRGQRPRGTLTAPSLRSMYIDVARCTKQVSAGCGNSYSCANMRRRQLESVHRRRSTHSRRPASEAKRSATAAVQVARAALQVYVVLVHKAGAHHGHGRRRGGRDKAQRGGNGCARRGKIRGRAPSLTPINSVMCGMSVPKRR